MALVTVIVGSLLPSESAPMKELDKLELSDKLEHFGAYLVLAMLPALHEKRRNVIATTFGAIALGVALEYAQRYTGWRDFEYGDMVADAAGAIAGAVVGSALSVWLFRSPGKSLSSAPNTASVKRV
jgi:VanZ family protein